MSADTLMPPSGPGAVREFVRSASEAPLPDHEEVRSWARAARRGDSAAFEQMVRTHRRVVVDEAIRCRGAGDRAVDLIPAGMLALVQAARTWSPDDHEPFPRYCRRRIRDAMEHVLSH